MRKIEAEMLQAVALKKDWSKDNTEVLRGFGGANMSIFLHGHHIATTDEWGGVVPNLQTLRAYPSRTTMSRLWALGVKVCRRKGRIILDGKDIGDCWGWS
jgi:hypothetical protein